MGPGAGADANGASYETKPGRNCETGKPKHHNDRRQSRKL